jgi:hypothetical protein
MTESGRPGVKVQGVAPLSWRVGVATARQHGFKNDKGFEYYYPVNYYQSLVLTGYH